MAKVFDLKEEDGVMTFTIANIDVSYVNAIRRTILSDIPIVCFKTTPYEQNKANIVINKTRLNNEILKQRLSCIPICIKNLEYYKAINYLNELMKMLNISTYQNNLHQYLHLSMFYLHCLQFVSPSKSSLKSNLSTN